MCLVHQTANSDEDECKVEVLRVVRIDDVYYEYIERACVQLSFYEGMQLSFYEGKLVHMSNRSIA